MDSKIKNMDYLKYLNYRNKIICNFFSNMNPQQLKAVLSISGPSLILAGAGSGKTTVMVNRIANILKYGIGLTKNQVEVLSSLEWDFLENYKHYQDSLNPLSQKLIFCNQPKPWQILAITFTNKAADELKFRLESILGKNIAQDVNASTFHSACVNILRKNIDSLGYEKDFTIYDADDSKKIISDIISSMNLDVRVFTVKSIMSQISAAKSDLISPEAMIDQEDNNYKTATIAKIYSAYQEELFKSNALDFDDIIKLTVELFQKDNSILNYYQNKFKYIMVDEYQDTNHAQFKLIYMLAKQHNNICVVGDDDQSIYKFRGATIDNILNFEKYFKNTLVIRLEQNYRSTKNILDIANAVISKNFIRKEKRLWTNNNIGEKTVIYSALNEYGEAKFVVDTILSNTKKGYKYSDNAILYRANFQSNIVEQSLVKASIPYKIIGGLRFYERKEIKDIISYLSVVNNPNDSLRLKRIINEPKRGIGDTTINIAQNIAQQKGISLFEVIDNSKYYKELDKKSNILMSFSEMIKKLIVSLNQMSLSNFINELLYKTGYIKYIEMLGKEGQSKLDNINQLILNVKKYESFNQNPSLEGFLEEISLYSDPESIENSKDSQVVLMTLHSAKGLEFPQVMIIGMEEGIFPSSQVIYDYKDIEEERRLAYVGFTRAKNNLYLIYSKERKLFNKTLVGVPSRFINEIPEYLCSFETQNYPASTRDVVKYKAKMAIDNKKLMNVRKTLGIGFGTNLQYSKNVHKNFETGCNVKHKIFGIGKVTNVIPMANDFLLEIDFNKVGKKKVMANFTGLKICDF